MLVVDLEAAVRLDADRLEPDALRAGSPADRDQELLASIASPRPPAPPHLPVPARPRSPWCRCARPRRVSRSAVGHLLARERLLVRSTDPRLDQGHLGPEASPRLCQLDADRAAAEHDQARRDPLRGGRLAVVPGLGLAQPVDRRDRRVGAGRDAPPPCRRPARRRPPSPGARRRAAAPAEELDAALLEPRQLAGVVEVVDHLVAAAQRRLGVQLAGDRLGGPRDAARPRRAASAGRSSAFDGMQA